VPISIKGKSDGFIAAVFNAQECLNHFLAAGVASGEAMTVSQGGRLVYERDADVEAAKPGWIARDTVVLPGAKWDLRVWPAPALAAQRDSPLPEIVLYGGALSALLLGAACFFAQRSRRHEARTAAVNAALQQALAKVNTLEGMLPICTSCKRVRERGGYWTQIDTYLGHHTNAAVSHGYCPECAAKAFTESGFEVPEYVQEELAAGNFE
jgi:hypothetical protein